MQKSLVVLALIALAATACWLLCPFGTWLEEAPRDHAPQGPETAAAERAHGTAAAATGSVDATTHRRESGPRVEAGDPDQPPEPPTTDVVVRVLLQQADTPVAGAAVRLVDTSLETPYAAATQTDDLGRARFAVPSEAPRHLIAYLSGGGEVWFELQPGQTAKVTLRLLAVAIIEGTVVDADDHVIAGAALVFLPWMMRKVTELPRIGIVGHTGSDGSFRVLLPSGGHLGAIHPRFAPSAMKRIDSTPPTGVPQLQRLKLTLRGAPAQVSGVVVDRHSAPVPFAAIEFTRVPEQRTSLDLESPPIRLRADEHGRFQIAPLPRGRLRFEALSLEHGCARGEFTADDREPQELRIELQAAAALRGRVTDADGGTPLAGAAVQAGNPGDLLSQRAETDVDGSYRLEHLPGGPNHLTVREVQPRPQEQIKRSVTATLELATGQETVWSPQLESLAGQRLTGLVVDRGQRPLAGWQVLTHQVGGERQRLRTDEQGGFWVPVRADTGFVVRVFAPQQPLRSFAAAIARDVDPGAGLLRLEIDTAAGTATVRGRVASSTGEAVPATVSCMHRASRQSVYTTAAADGSFRFEAVPAGAVLVFARHPGFLAIDSSAVVMAAGELDLGLLTLAAGTAVSGSVTSTAGALPQQLTIRILTDARRYTAELAGDSYRFDAVPPGSHRLQVQGEGIAGASHAIEVLTEIEQVQDIIVEPGVARRIVVASLASGGNWITLVLQRSGEPYSWLEGQPRGTEPAEFEACMAPGTYEAIAWDDAGHQTRSVVRFASNGEPPVRIELPAN